LKFVKKLDKFRYKKFIAIHYHKQYGVGNKLEISKVCCPVWKMRLIPIYF